MQAYIFDICQVNKTNIDQPQVCIHLNNKMLFLVTHARYEGGEMAEKIPYPRKLLV